MLSWPSLFFSGVGPHEVFEFSGVKLKNGLKIDRKTMLFEGEITFAPKNKNHASKIIHALLTWIVY